MGLDASGKGGAVELPPAVEKIARNGDVITMIDNGRELDFVEFDDKEHPTEALFVFGNDTYLTFKRHKKKP